MGLRQSKRSVDISGSPKKEAPAAVVEKIPQNNDATNQTIENIEEEIKTPINGETKTTEAVELVIFHHLTLSVSMKIVSISVSVFFCFSIGQEHPGGCQRQECDGGSQR
jgi:hypothetical protein